MNRFFAICVAAVAILFRNVGRIVGTAATLVLLCVIVLAAQNWNQVKAWVTLPLPAETKPATAAAPSTASASADFTLTGGSSTTAAGSVKADNDMAEVHASATASIKELGAKDDAALLLTQSASTANGTRTSNTSQKIVMAVGSSSAYTLASSLGRAEEIAAMGAAKASYPEVLAATGGTAATPAPQTLNVNLHVDQSGTIKHEGTVQHEGKVQHEGEVKHTGTFDVSGSIKVVGTVDGQIRGELKMGNVVEKYWQDRCGQWHKFE